MARVLADNASVIDMTGISEGETGYRTAANHIIIGPTIINRALPLVITINDPGASGTLRIYNIHGQMVKDLGSRAGNATVTWSLNDGSGYPMPAGIYFVRYESGTTAATRKFVIAE